MSSLYGSSLTNKQILDNLAFRWPKCCLDVDLLALSKKPSWLTGVAWTSVPFKSTSRLSIPEEKGIYMFVLPAQKAFDTNGHSNYILYIGQASDLRERFMTYFHYPNSTRPSDFLKRCMTVIWGNHLTFCFYQNNALTQDELDEIEFAYIDATLPPMNQAVDANLAKEAVKFYRLHT